MLPGSKKRLFLSYFPSGYVRICACMDGTLMYGMVKALLSDHCHIIAVTTRAGCLREWFLVSDQAMINLSIRAVIYESSVLAKVSDIHTMHSFWICLVFTLVSTNCDKKSVFIFSLFFQGIDWEKFSNGITVILSPGDVNYAKDHGVAKLGKDVRVFSIINVNLKIALSREHRFTVLLCLLCSCDLIS